MKKNLRTLLWIFALVPLVVTVATELNKGILVWNFRIVDFLDLLILAPFYLIILLALQANIFAARTSRSFWLALGMIGVFIYGHAMHLTGNAIHTFAIEARSYRSLLPEDLYNLIYFLDEDLGHWLIFGGLFALLAIWGSQAVPAILLHWTDVLLGIILGASYAISIVESSQPWLGFVAAALLLGVVFHKASWRLRRFASTWRADLLWRVLLVTALSLVLVEVMYAVVAGGFIQPSQL